MESRVRSEGPHGYPLLQSFRVVFELPGLRERYDRLVFDSDSEWPTILHHNGYELGYMEVEGPEWEAQQKRNMMTLPDGRKVDPKEYYETSPEPWVYRLMLAHGIARAAYRAHKALSR